MKDRIVAFSIGHVDYFAGVGDGEEIADIGDVAG